MTMCENSQAAITNALNELRSMLDPEGWVGDASTDNLAMNIR